MKGIIVNKKQFEKLSTPVKNRLIVEKRGDTFALIDPHNDEQHMLGEAISDITGMKKIPKLLENGTAGWAYPRWDGKTIDEQEE